MSENTPRINVSETAPAIKTPKPKGNPKVYRLINEEIAEDLLLAKRYVRHSTFGLAFKHLNSALDALGIE